MISHAITEDEQMRRRRAIAHRLMEVRIQKGLNIQQLAALIETSQGIVGEYESAVTDITLDALMAISKVLGCSIDYLVGNETKDMETPKGRLTAAFERLPMREQLLVCGMLEGAAAEIGR